MPSFTNRKDIIGAKLKKTGHVTLITPIRWWSVIPRLALDIFYLQTKVGDSRFSRFEDTIVGVQIKNVSCDPGHIHFRGGLSFKS